METTRKRKPGGGRKKGSTSIKAEYQRKSVTLRLFPQLFDDLKTIVEATKNSLPEEWREHVSQAMILEVALMEKYALLVPDDMPRREIYMALLNRDKVEQTASKTQQILEVLQNQ